MEGLAPSPGAGTDPPPPPGTSFQAEWGALADSWPGGWERGPPPFASVWGLHRGWVGVAGRRAGYSPPG